MTKTPSAEELAESAKAAAHYALTNASFYSVLTTSPLIDKVASWFLAGIGATLALIVGNLDKTIGAIKAITIFGLNRISLVLVLLIVGGLFGLLQKYMAIRVQIWLHITKKINKCFPRIFKAHQEQERIIKELAGDAELKPDTSIDIAKLISEIEISVPWYQRSSFKKNYMKSTQDQFHGLRTAAQFYNHQVLYALGELFSAVIALILVATGI